MFDKLKDLHKLKALQDEIKKETVEVEKDGIKVVMRGDFEVMSITLSSELDINLQGDVVRDCLNEAKSNLQAKLAQNFAGV